MNSEIAEIRKAIAQNPPTAGSFEDRRARWEPLFRKICPIPTGTSLNSLLQAYGRFTEASLNRFPASAEGSQRPIVARCSRCR